MFYPNLFLSYKYFIKPRIAEKTKSLDDVILEPLRGSLGKLCLKSKKIPKIFGLQHRSGETTKDEEETRRLKKIFRYASEILE